jgi:hypothetical protein
VAANRVDAGHAIHPAVRLTAPRPCSLLPFSGLSYPGNEHYTRPFNLHALTGKELAGFTVARRLWSSPCFSLSNF